MLSTGLEQDSSQLLTELFEGTMSKQQIGYLVSLVERVSVMEETLDSYLENTSEMTI